VLATGKYPFKLNYEFIEPQVIPAWSAMSDHTSRAVAAFGRVVQDNPPAHLLGHPVTVPHLPHSLQPIPMHTHQCHEARLELSAG